MTRLIKGLGATLVVCLLLAAQTARADSYVISDLLSNSNVLVSNQVVGNFTGDFSAFTSWTNAVNATYNSAWVPESQFMPGSHWITSGLSGLNYYGTTYMDFRLTVDVGTLATDTLIQSLIYSADNAVQIYLNGILLVSLDPQAAGQSDSSAYGSLHTVALTYLAGGSSTQAVLKAGSNTFDFVTTNYAQSGGSSSSNPTSLAFSSATPEPGTMILFGSAAGLLGVRRRRQVVEKVKSWLKAA